VRAWGWLWKLVAIILAGLLYLVLAVTGAQACGSTPVTPNTPTGIAGCEVFGEGTASHYGPGSGVAMNFCTWERRHTYGCGTVRITSVDTGLVVDAPVVDFCDCYTGTGDQRVVDLQYGVVAALGLDLSRGLYSVVVVPLQPSQGPAPVMLPDTALQGG
jgi:hypothetical protein